MRYVGVTIILLALLLVPAGAQTVRVVAVADLVDDSAQGPAIGASQFNAVLAGLISQRSAGRMTVADTAAVRSAQRARGYSPRDLISPSRAIEIAQAVGADLIITGRWDRLESDLEEHEVIDNMRFPRIASALAVLDIRVLEVGTRKAALQESFWAQITGRSVRGPLYAAALTVLQQAADRISKL